MEASQRFEQQNDSLEGEEPTRLKAVPGEFAVTEELIDEEQRLKLEHDKEFPPDPKRIKQEMMRQRDIRKGRVVLKHGFHQGL
jgi:hypothetical protein